MLTYTQLVALQGALRNERVLSVYLDGSSADPAQQRSWRVQLEQSLANLRAWLEGSPHDERESLGRCVRLLDGLLATFDGGVGTPGWAAFITADGVREAQHLPAPTPTLAVWSTGICVTPYLRVLQQSRPAVVAVADARKVRLYRHRLGNIEHFPTLRAHADVAETSHMGAPARQGFHSGTRGATGRDAAQRTLLTGRDRLLAATIKRVVELAGDDGWILLGGIKREVARMAQQLAALAPDRTMVLESLDVHASEAEIAAAARLGGATLRDAMDARRLGTIAEMAGAHGLGVLGAADARQALAQRSVRELYLTSRYVDDHFSDAEELVRTAVEQDATVEEVSGSAAAELEQRGGIAAGLRFRPPTIEHPVEAGATA